MVNQELFDYMQNEHGVILLESEANDLIQVVNAVLQKELDVTNQLLNERQKVLDAIPECPDHGSCVPHAIKWINDMVGLKKKVIELRIAQKAYFIHSTTISLIKCKELEKELDFLVSVKLF